MHHDLTSVQGKAFHHTYVSDLASNRPRVPGITARSVAGLHVAGVATLLSDHELPPYHPDKFPLSHRDAGRMYHQEWQLYPSQITLCESDCRTEDAYVTLERTSGLVTSPGVLHFETILPSLQDQH